MNFLYSSWEKVMKQDKDFTSQVQEVQERMNYLNDSGDFHEVESNCCGKCSHIPTPPARTSCAIWAELRQNTGNLKHGIHLDYRKSFFANPRSTLKSLQIPYQGTHPFCDINCCRSGSRAGSAQGELKEKEAQFQCRHLREGRRLWTPLFLWIFHRVLWLGSCVGR